MEGGVSYRRRFPAGLLSSLPRLFQIFPSLGDRPISQPQALEHEARDGRHVRLLIATGLKVEAKLMTDTEVTVIAGGGDCVRLERELEAASANAELVLSSGLAGALDPNLEVGDFVLDGPIELVERLRTLLPKSHVGPVLGSDIPIGSIEAKAKAVRCGAVAVDMESHIARRV